MIARDEPHRVVVKDSTHKIVEVFSLGNKTLDNNEFAILEDMCIEKGYYLSIEEVPNEDIQNFQELKRSIQNL